MLEAGSGSSPDPTLMTQTNDISGTGPAQPAARRKRASDKGSASPLVIEISQLQVRVSRVIIIVIGWWLRRAT